MNRVFATIVAGSLLLGACATVTQPVGPVPPKLDTTITDTFIALNVSLAGLEFVPGLPAAVVIEAKALNTSLQAAYASYKSNPSATKEQAAVQAAITAVETFMRDQAKPALAKMNSKSLAAD